MKDLHVLLFLTSISAVLADNHTTTNSTSDGLSGGAVAGIVIGVLAGVTAIGVGVWYFFMNSSTAAMGAGAAATTAGKIGDNHLPMMAMRVNAEDDEI
jgi:hypothetical protein